MKCWRQLLGNKLWVVPKHFSGFPGLRQAELRLMMTTNALVDECPVQRQKWQRVRQIICEDRRRTIDEVSMLVGISHGTCHKLLTEDLKMRRVPSKFVPRLLSVDQKQPRLDVCLDLKKNAAKDPQLSFECHYGWRNLVLCLRPGNQNSIQWKEKSEVTSTEEGKASETQHQVNVDLFLWSEGNCSRRICSSWSNS